MLKQLLKYEFKATKSLYFGLYLALALLSVVLGVSFRQENAWADNTNFGRLEVILMVLYLSVIFAIAVLCFVSTVQRFYKNLLGREGYLMHTLPVTETQLILSKLITSMVWVLCSGLVGIVCITVMVAVGVFDSETFGMADWESWKQLWGMLYGELGARFWLVTFWTILINLARLADLILCVYAACMIAHPFRKLWDGLRHLRLYRPERRREPDRQAAGHEPREPVCGHYLSGGRCERDRCDLWNDPDADHDHSVRGHLRLSVLLCCDLGLRGGLLLPDPLADEA